MRGFGGIGGMLRYTVDFQVLFYSFLIELTMLAFVSHSNFLNIFVKNIEKIVISFVKKTNLTCVFSRYS